MLKTHTSNDSSLVNKIELRDNSDESYDNINSFIVYVY